LKDQEILQIAIYLYTMYRL